MLKTNYSEINKVDIDGVPAYVVRPVGDFKNYKTIIFYHGWGSSAKNQIFRANIFASYGYQVVLPEERYHGERGSLNYDDKSVLREKMCEIIMHNIEEFPQIYKYTVEELNADSENIILSGHSMGAITASGLFTFKKSIKAAVLFNGICDWKKVVDSASVGEVSYEMMRINEFMLQMNPKEHLENLVDRHLIMYNGEDDKSIDPRGQEEFYKLAREAYTEKEKIKFKMWELTTHQVTTQMLEGAIEEIKKITD